MTGDLEDFNVSLGGLKWIKQTRPTHGLPRIGCLVVQDPNRKCRCKRNWQINEFYNCVQVSHEEETLAKTPFWERG